MRIDKTELYKALLLKVAGTLNVTAAGTPVADGPLDYIRKVVVKLASTPIIELPGRSLYNLAHIFGEGKAPSKTDVPAGTGNHSWGVTIPISFEMLRFLVPEVSLLPAWRYQSPTLEVTFGTEADIYTGGTTGGPADLTADVLKNVVIDVDPVQLRTRSHEWLVTIMEQIEKQVTANSQNFQVDLSTGRFKRALLISTIDGTTYEDDIINSFVIKRATSEEVFKATWTQLRERNEDLYGITMPPGFAIVDWVENKDGEDIFDATQDGALTLIADVAVGTGTTKVFVDEIDLVTSGLPALAA